MLTFHRVVRVLFPEGDAGGAAGGGGGGEKPPEKKPFAVFTDQEAFETRLAREVRSRLKAEGIEDPAKLKEILTELEELKKAKKTEEEAKLSETQKLTSKIAELEGRHQTTESRLARAVLEGEVARHCAAKGVRNYEYALYTVERAGSKLEAGKSLDLDAHFEGMLKDEKLKAALDVLQAPEPPDRKKVGADTDPEKGGIPTPPEGKPGDKGGTGQKSVLDMTEAEFRAHKSGLSQRPG